MYIYKNTSDSDLAITNVGVVEAGKTIESPVELNHPDLKLTKEEKPKKDS